MRFKRFLTLILFTATVTGAWAQVPRSKHVVVVTLENHSYEQVVGSSQMPYFNKLLSEYSVTDQYYATMHNSISALMWITAGETVTTHDNTKQFFNVDNIVRHMQRDGRSWKVYASHLPYTGYLGYNVGEYVKRHNPIAYFTDVESSLKYNIVPSDPYFQRDVANGTLPEYSYVTPDLIEDAHSAPLADADKWLKANIPQLLASPQFKEDGILFIVWDEGDVQPVDPRNGGGRIATLVLGPHVKRGYHSQVQYNHQSLLRSTCLALALSGCPGGGAEGVPMTDLFEPTQAPNLQPNLIAPAQNKVDGTVYLEAVGISGTHPATVVAAYIGSSLAARELDLKSQEHPSPFPWNLRIDRSRLGHLRRFHRGPPNSDCHPSNPGGEADLPNHHPCLRTATYRSDRHVGGQSSGENGCLRRRQTRGANQRPESGCKRPGLPWQLHRYREGLGHQRPNRIHSVFRHRAVSLL